jgi:hypothetical protein
MKISKTIFAYFLLLTGAAHLSSCLKENESGKKPDCRIGTITAVGSNGKTVTLITYNGNGKISTVDVLDPNGGTVNKVITYIGNTINIDSRRTSGSNTTTTRDSITLDDRGRAVNIRTFNLNGTPWTNNRIVYNGDELVRTEFTTETSPTPQVSTHTYVDGNLISSTTPWGNTSAEYYTDKELQQGDYNEILYQTTYGISIGPNKNLVKSMTLPGNNLNFNYEMDSQGLISKLTIINGGLASTVTYHYICD